MAEIIDHLTHELKQYADLNHAAVVGDRYRVNVANYWGVRTPTIRQIASQRYQSIKTLSFTEILPLCEQLLQTGTYELELAAFHWAYLSRQKFQPEHLDTFDRWLTTYVTSWIDCDDLCLHVIGILFLDHPLETGRVFRWLDSPNLWLRRGAAVSLIPPARHRDELNRIFTVVDRLLADPEDLVHKGYGWLLKEASKKYPQAVFDYVNQKNLLMKSLAFRCAIAKLPPPLQKKALKARQKLDLPEA